MIPLIQSFIPEFDKDTEMLFTGAKLSSLEATTLLVSWFSMFPSMSKEAFSRLLYLLHTFILPDKNTLPSSYHHAVKKIKPFLSPIKEYHVCPKDCIIYRDCDDGEFEKLSVQFVVKVDFFQMECSQRKYSNIYPLLKE